MCRHEIPNLIETYGEAKDFRFISINPGINDSLDRTKRYRDKYKLPYPIIYDEEGISAQIFGVVGVPTAFLINKKGEVVYAGFPPPARKISEFFSAE